jgi:hypothetical protein
MHVTANGTLGNWLMGMNRAIQVPPLWRKHVKGHGGDVLCFEAVNLEAGGASEGQ